MDGWMDSIREAYWKRASAHVVRVRKLVRKGISIEHKAWLRPKSHLGAGDSKSRSIEQKRQRATKFEFITRLAVGYIVKSCLMLAVWTVTCDMILPLMTAS